MKGLVTSLGETVLALVRQYQPHAVTLDFISRTLTAGVSWNG